jgi:hypothetical protein
MSGTLLKKQKWRAKWVDRFFELEDAQLSYTYPVSTAVLAVVVAVVSIVVAIYHYLHAAHTACACNITILMRPNNPCVSTTSTGHNG